MTFSAAVCQAMSCAGRSMQLSLAPFLSQVADVWKLENLVVIGLNHQQQPQEKPSQCNQTGKWEHQYSHEGDQLQQHPEKESGNGKSHPHAPQNDVLKGMKTNKAVPPERLQI